MLKKLFVAVVAGSAVQHAALGQNYPTRPITLLTTMAQNTSYYPLLRMTADSIQARTGSTIVFEPAMGANGTLGPARTKRAEPDGYILCVSFASALTMEPLLQKEKLFDTLKDFTYVTMLTQHGIVFLSRTGFAPNNLIETIAYAKANPEKVKVGVASAGGRVGLNQIEEMTGAKFFIVPYKTSSQSELALYAGEIDLYYQAAGTAVSLVKGGKMKPLFIGSKARSVLFPNLGTISEALPNSNVEIGSWFGLLGPAGMAADRVNWHLREWGAAIREPKIADALEKQNGYEIVMAPPQQFMNQVRRELEANQRTINKYNIGSN